MPVRISAELASLLESHPMLPFQGAGGLTALTAQAFQDHGVAEDFTKGSPTSRPSGKGKQTQTAWGRFTQNYATSYSYSSYPAKESKKGHGKSQAKGDWKERDHDHRTNWKDPNNDTDNNGDRWGSGPYNRLRRSPSHCMEMPAPPLTREPNNRRRTPTKKARKDIPSSSR